MTIDQQADEFAALFDGTQSAKLHAAILRTGALSREHALHIAGATDYDTLLAEIETLRKYADNDAVVAMVYGKKAERLERERDAAIAERDRLREALTKARDFIAEELENRNAGYNAKAAIRYALMLAQEDRQDALEFPQSWIDEDLEALITWNFNGTFKPQDFGQ